MTTMTTTLAPAITKAEARPLLNAAKRHWKGAMRNALQFSAELRHLQDAGAHNAYGFADFGEWASTEFEDLTVAQARKFSQQGAILLELEQAGKLSLKGQIQLPVGTTAVRALTSLRSNHTLEDVLAVFDKAHHQHRHKVLSGADILGARRELLPAVKYSPELSPPAEEAEAAPKEPYRPGPEEAISGPDAVAELHDLAIGLKGLVDDCDWVDVDPDAAQLAYQELERQVGKLKLLISGGPGTGS